MREKIKGLEKKIKVKITNFLKDNRTIKNLNRTIKNHMRAYSRIFLI
jgi:hypothetical protein